MNTSKESNSKSANQTFVNYKPKLKIAFVGGAYDSAVGRAHRAAISMDQYFELIAGCFSRNKEKNIETAIQYGVDTNRIYNDFNSLLEYEKENIDAIVILTPQNQHIDQINKSLDFGIPIICEKALVSSSKEAIAIREKLIKKKGFLAVTYNYTGYPMIRELKHMIRSGFLGEIQQLHMEMPQEGFARLSNEGKPIYPQNWRLKDSFVPTISLDLGVHLHMMGTFLTGSSPIEVVSVASSRGNFNEVIDNVQFLANYTNNIDSSYWYSKTAFGYRNGLKIRIFGKKGSAEWVQGNPEYINFADNSGGKYCLDRTSKNIKIANNSRYQRFKAGHPAGFLEAFANYYVDLAHSLYKKKNISSVSESIKYVFGVNESIEGLKMLESVARSSSSKKWEIIK